MSLLKDLFTTARAIGDEITGEARKRVKPYLPLAAELYNEVASRVSPKVPTVDVDRLLEDLYPRVDTEPSWTPPPRVKPEPQPTPAKAEEKVEAAPVVAPAPKPEVPKVPVEKTPVAAKPAPKKASSPQPAARKKAATLAPKKAVAAKPAVKTAAVALAKDAPNEASLGKTTTRKTSMPKRRRVPTSRERQTTLIGTKVDPKALAKLMAMTKTDLRALAAEKKVALRPTGTKKTIAEAILAQAKD